MTKYPTKPTQRIKHALNELLQYNEHTRGREPAEMYLGKDIFVVRLREPRVISGQWEDVDRTVDIFDLMDAYQDEQRNRLPQDVSVESKQ